MTVKIVRLDLTASDLRREAARTKDADALCCANIAPAVACQPVEASTDPDGCWHTEACHPIQHIASNLCFDLLTGQSPGEESPSNDGFVSIHCSLNEASPVVARTTLPAHATMPFDGCNLLIALRRPAPYLETAVARGGMMMSASGCRSVTAS